MIESLYKQKDGSNNITDEHTYKHRNFENYFIINIKRQDA